MWVYIQSEERLFTVGFYDPQGQWHPEFDGTKEECTARVAYLNGGSPVAKDPPSDYFQLDDDRLHDLSG